MEELRYQQICNFLDGKLSATPKKALAQWRKANRENEKQFQEIKFLWQKTRLAKKGQGELKIDVNAALTKVHQQLPKTTKVIPLRKRLLRFSAAASVLIILGFIGWLTFLQPIAMIQVATLSNETKQVTLPDNSTVWLNENSRLSYPKQFDNKTRTVTMTGDVVFEVTHHPQQPFVVTTNDLAVKVLGTKFNVQSDADKNTSAFVYVLNGKVQVQKKEAPSQKVLLTKGMTAQLNAQTAQLGLTDAFSSNQLFWMTKTLTFEGTPFKEVIVDLNQAYKKEVILTNTDLLNCPVRGTFTDKTLAEILATLQLIYGFDIEKINSQSPQLNNGICN